MNTMVLDSVDRNIRTVGVSETAADQGPCCARALGHKFSPIQSDLGRRPRVLTGDWAGGRFLLGWCLAIGWALIGTVAQDANAQIGRYPAPGYYLLLGQDSSLQSGEFRDAERAIQNLYRGAYREGNQRWVDSAAYLYLLGETRYQAGDYAGAMQAFDEAYEIYASVINWGVRVSWDMQPIVADPNAMRLARISWGASNRQATLGRFPTSFSVRFGQDIIVPGEQGNTRIPQERLVPVDVIEMYRAMAHVIRRRDQILGVLSQVDAPARTMRAQLNEARNTVPGVLPTALGSILYGIALTGEGDLEGSNAVLQRTVQINGFDHPLTPVVLLHIGYNQYLLGDYRSAKATLLEASYSAGFFNQFDVFRESLVLAGRAHMAVNRDPLLPELDGAFEWARVRGLRVAQAQFAMVAAENAIENGLMTQASKQLGIAASLMRTSDLRRGEMALRLNVLEQAIAAITGTNTDLSLLRAALVAYRPATNWAFQVDLLVNPARRRMLTTGTLTTLIETVLRDPTQADWDRDPFECLAYLTGDRSQFAAETVSLLLNKKDYSGALFAAENLKRVQFYSRLPLGGRLMSFRELLARSPDELSPELRRKQAELRSRFEALNELLNQAETLIGGLRQAPLQPTDETARAWESNVERLAALGQQIEQQLVQVSVRRDAIPLLFPPPVDQERIQAQIPARTLVMVILQRDNAYHTLLVTSDRVVYQASLNQTSVGRAIRGLAKTWGHSNASAVLQTKVVADNTWKGAAHNLLKAMIPKNTPEFWDSFDELVVIPTGLFWYLPFETLALSEDVESELLIDKVAVRYAPSLNLAFTEQRPKRLDRILYYPSKIDLRDEDPWLESARATFQEVCPKAYALESSKFPPQSLVGLVDAMVYWNEIRQDIWPMPWTAGQSKRDAHLQLDLDQWIRFPNIGPEFLMVAGGNSALADGLRGNSDGTELEFYSTLLMAAGCQSMVLPRWRSGGHLAYDMQNAIIQHVPQMTTAAAVREAILKVRKSPLDPERQTRLRPARGEAPETADHPFWWAGQMVIDRGSWYRDPDGEPGLRRPGDGVPQLQLGGEPPVDGQAPPVNPPGGNPPGGNPPGGEIPPGKEQAAEAEGGGEQEKENGPPRVEPPAVLPG